MIVSLYSLYSVENKLANPVVLKIKNYKLQN